MSTEAYCTLLYNDAYLPGALVLAHCLREYGTTKELVVLVGPDVSPKALDRLSAVFDNIVPTATISTSAKDAPQFRLLDRPDLDRCYTKINVWRLEQYSRVVFLDADTLPIRNIDELFDKTEVPLSQKIAVAGAPDIGWPDIFNSGVFVLLPSVETFTILAGRARAGLSFDGGDQGLLNQFFEDNWHHLPFSYNVTPSASYQYTPAYQHFKDEVAIVHFIGQDKPWSHTLSGPFPSSSEFEVKWWNVYNKYYNGNLEPINGESGQGESSLVESVYDKKDDNENKGQSSMGHTFGPDVMRWDATRQLPPMGSKPEAANLEEKKYSNVWDDPARNDPAYVKYSNYKSSSHTQPAPKKEEEDTGSRFPWEKRGQSVERVFPEDYGYHETEGEYRSQQSTQNQQAEKQQKAPEPVSPPKQVPVTRVFHDYSVAPSSDTAAFDNGLPSHQRNVWDTNSGIQRYVDHTTKALLKKEKHEARLRAIRNYEREVQLDQQEESKASSGKNSPLRSDTDFSAPDDADILVGAKQDQFMEENIKEELDEVKKNPLIHGKIMQENQDGVILKKKTETEETFGAEGTLEVEEILDNGEAVALEEAVAIKETIRTGPPVDDTLGDKLDDEVAKVSKTLENVCKIDSKKKK